jgi:hypothetical protein
MISACRNGKLRACKHAVTGRGPYPRHPLTNGITIGCFDCPSSAKAATSPTNGLIMIKHVRALAVAAALAVPALASAQDKQFEVGTKLLNVGLLVGSESAGSLGAGAGFEVGIKNIQDQVVLGVGGSIGYSRTSVGALGLVKGYDFNVIPVLGFVHGHYQLKNVPKLDLYAGPAIGVTMSKWDDDFCGSLPSSICETSKTDVAVGLQAGGRWALTPKVLGWAQLSAGNAMPFLNVGVSFKF